MPQKLWLWICETGAAVILLVFLLLLSYAVSGSVPANSERPVVSTFTPNVAEPGFVPAKSPVPTLRIDNIGLIRRDEAESAPGTREELLTESFIVAIREVLPALGTAIQGIPFEAVKSLRFSVELLFGRSTQEEIVVSPQVVLQSRPAWLEQAPDGTTVCQSETLPDEDSEALLGAAVAEAAQRLVLERSEFAGQLADAAATELALLPDDFRWRDCVQQTWVETTSVETAAGRQQEFTVSYALVSCPEPILRHAEAELRRQVQSARITQVGTAAAMLVFAQCLVFAAVRMPGRAT
ncbi:MAG: hypothetical protein ACPGXX_16495 [Planctomycetaceae bacterium]